MLKENLIHMCEKSFRDHRELPALTDYFKGETFSYYEMAKEIAKLHMLFDRAGIKKGDHIAVVGRNNARWVIAYVATITYGAVIVPLFQEFRANDLNHYINHSDAKLLFAGDNSWDSVDGKQIRNIKAAFSLTDFSCVYERYGQDLSKFQRNILSHYRTKYPKGFTINDIKYDERDSNSTMSVSYTSGTMGFSRGVMLTVNNFTGNVAFALDRRFHFRGSRVLSLLPLAHSYGCAFDMLAPLAAGSHITLMGSIPATKVFIRAMHDVKPHLICTVPYVVETLVRRQILPIMEKAPIRLISKMPMGGDVVNSAVRKKLMAAFGGEITEVIIGGAPMNTEVAELLQHIKFPFTVGYGMTECAPLISYSPPAEYTIGSCGKVCPGMEAKVDSDDAWNIPGEIMVRGEHVMKGYYKDDKGTAEVFDNDGWMRTGDVGTIAPDGAIYLKGRRYSSINIPGRETVYPEGIEAKLNVLPCVMESLITERDGRLVALVVPDYEQADARLISVSGLAAVMNENLNILNTLVASHERVDEIILFPEEFDKTPKRSIKRYIYTGQAQPD